MSQESKLAKPLTRSASKLPKSKHHEYSPKISERRRALFPSNNNSLDDLNLEDMTPIAESCSDDGFSPTENLEEQKPAENHKSPLDRRIRTNLFPNAYLPIPAQSFYKNSGSNSAPIVHRRSASDFVPITKLSPSPSRPHPRTSRRSKYGEINAGVKHGLRKPKKPDLDKKLLLIAAENILDNSPLNDYLDQQKQVKNKPAERRPKPHDPDDEALCEYIKTLDEFNIIKSNGTNGDTDSTHIVKQIQPAVSTARNKEEHETASRKRSPSPLPESDQNRKFFKSSRSKSLSAVRQSKPHPSDSKINSSSFREKNTIVDFELDEPDLDGSANGLMPSEKMDAILNLLEDKENVEHESVQTNGNDSQLPIPPQEYAAGTSQISPTNVGKGAGLGTNQLSSLIVANHNKNMLMSPTTQMCDMTSILAINSPKRARNLTNAINGTTNGPETSCRTAVLKKFKSLSKDQMLLDAGQKNFGIKQCHECKFVYHLGDPDDEIMHIDYHTGADVLRFSGWKNERIVEKCYDGARILQILPPDPKAWRKKISTLLEIVNRDLGYFDMSLNIEDSQVFIYVKDKMIIGCLVAGHEFRARKMLTDSSGVDLCSEEEYSIKCGISRIWVSQEHRKKKIATTLMNCLKRNFMHGYMLTDEDIAFSSPSDLGKQFARKYFKTPNFLIYGV